MEIKESLFKPEDPEPSLSFPNLQPDHSQNIGWYNGTIASIQIAAQVDPTPSLNVFESDLPLGVVVHPLDAVDWQPGRRNVDIRPRLVGSDGQARLVDSGAMISTEVR